MANFSDGNIENGMVLFDERDYWRCDDKEEENEYRDEFYEEEALEELRK